MSSQTPNLNLVLPVGTEKVSRQIINDNNTKIDTAVGSNSTAITNLQTNVASGTFNSKSALDTLLNNVLSSIGTDGKKSIKVVCNGGYDIFPNGGTFDCVINKFGSSTSYGTIFMQQVGSSKTIVGNKNDGTWSYEQLATKSRTPQYKTIDVSGTPITTSDSGWYYNQINYSSILPTNARIIGAASSGSWDANVFYTIHWPTSIKFVSSTSKTLGSGREMVIYYYVDN